MLPPTIYRVLEQAAQKYGDAPALRQPRTRDGKREYEVFSWNQYRDAAGEIAAGLHTLGVKKGDLVVLDSETRMEFYLCDLGILANGSVSAALYPSYPAEDLIRTIDSLRPAVVIVEDPKTFRALHRTQELHWVLMTGDSEGAIPLAELRARGRRAMEEDPELLARLTSAVNPDDPAILYLTSGATGEPKMARVTHRAVVSNLEMGPAALPLSPDDSTVAFLPSAHIAQRVVIELLPIPSGMPVTFSESLIKLPQDIRTVRPTILLAPPRMWERIYSTICTELRKKPKPVQKAFWGALAMGLAAARRRRDGKRVPAYIAAPLKAADLLFFRKVRMRFGGKLRVAASGAAPLGKDLAEFYEAIGMPLIEGYGLTEGGVLTLNPLDRPKPGSIGKLLAGVELRVSDEGELVIKSPSLFEEYFGDPETTAEVLRNGWLHTGDLGYVDTEGYVYITGRKKELIVSSTGKKIFPARVEALFKTEPLVSQVLLVGDRLPFLTALLTINATVAETLDGMAEWKGRGAEEVAAAPPVLGEISKLVARINRQLAPFEQVRRFRVLGRDFTIEQGELTATMKVRRTRVMENFRRQIDELYAGKES